MAITILFTQGLWALAKSPCFFSASSNQYLIDPGQNWGATFPTPITVPALNATTILTFMGKTFTYTWKDNPPQANCFEIDRAGGDPALALNSMMGKFAQNYLLNRYYSIGASSLQALNPGVFYTITITGTSGITFIHVLPGTDPIYRGDYRLLWDLYVAKENAPSDFVFVIGQQLALNSRLVTEPDMHELFQSILAPDIPTHGNTSVQYNLESIKLYKIKYADYYDGSPRCMGETEPQKAILAGVALDRFSTFDFVQQHAQNISQHRFLTNQPRRFTVASNVQTFLCLLAAQDFDVLIDVTWDNDTTTPGIPIHQIVGNSRSMMIIPTSYGALNINSYRPPGVTNAKEYSVYVQQDSSESEKFTFVMDYKFRLNPRTFIFHNSLNGWDTIWCTGDQDRGIEPLGDHYDTPVPFNFADVTQITKVVNSPNISERASHRRMFTINTGYKNKAYIQTLARELALSQKILFDAGQQWQDIKLERDSIKVIDNDNDDLWSLTFTYHFGFNDIAF